MLRARFNDARFFWEFDQRVPLVERVKLLENVTFQKDLGSYAAKSEARARACWPALAERVGGTVDAAALDEAARLAKTDLTTELVKEFTELQGVIGGLYAKAQGVSQIAAMRSTTSTRRRVWMMAYRVRLKVRCSASQIVRTLSLECSGSAWSRPDRKIRLRCGVRPMGL